MKKTNNDQTIRINLEGNKKKMKKKNNTAKDNI